MFCAVHGPRCDASADGADADLLIAFVLMIIALHKNARTTPAIRAETAASSDSVANLALRCGVGEGTIRRWRVFAFPSSFILDRQGRIRYSVNTAIEWDTAEVRAVIDRLRAGKDK